MVRFMTSWWASNDAGWWNDWQPDLPKGNQENLAVCECGARITYGDDIPGFMHISYCPLFKDDRQKKVGDT